jgi:4-hydroxythreonine-4-phosphate dehydrogenase
MMLASPKITVSLVTTHLALADVAPVVTADRVARTIELTTEAMVRIGHRTPRLTVCAFNPHGGEHGLFGREEEDVIVPAVERMRGRGAELAGPLPPDTAFLPGRLAATDAYIVMYHDQGLIPFKMLAFEEGVNVTLGLPIVRTSVDHGTAFDIAWQGKASVRSMIESIRWAVRLSAARGLA